MTKMRGVALTLAVLAAAAAQVRADVVYDTTPFWDGSSSIAPFGTPDTATYGQTFIAPTAPNDNLLSYTFYINPDLGVHIQMTGQVYAWSGNLLGGNPPQGAVGPALFSSAPISIDGNGSFQPVTVNTGGVTLTPGSAYIALMTVSDPADYSATTGTSMWGDILNQHVTNNGGGGFNFFNNGNDYGSINNGNWDDFSDFGDLAWKANFGPSTPSVPEPATVISGVVGVGLMGLVRVVRRRRRRADA